MLARVVYVLALLLCLAPFMSSGYALFLGVAIALTLGNPFADKTRAWTHKLLSWSVIGLGFGMNLKIVAQVGLQGIGYTVVGIFSALILGYILGRILKVESETSTLISVGTAICGGSAIAAVAPVIRAKPNTVSVALGTVFVLNATALFLFPFVGHQLNLSEHQFGLWAALAIHDTSSVVGASMQYGAEALQTGTTVKLARALWIVPVAFMIGLIYSRKNKDAGAAKGKKPWFIAGFLLAAALVTFVPQIQPFGHTIEAIAKRCLVVTLFLIGSSLTRETLKAVGPKPFFQGVLLWIIVGSLTLTAIVTGVIH